MTIQFLDELPTIKRGRNREPQHQDFATTLRDNQGKWAVLGEGLSTNTVKLIKDGTWSEFTPAGEFEAVSRDGDASGHATILVRYVGPSDQQVELPAV